MLRVASAALSAASLRQGGGAAASFRNRVGISSSSPAAAAAISPSASAAVGNSNAAFLTSFMMMSVRGFAGGGRVGGKTHSGASKVREKLAKVLCSVAVRARYSRK
jgi:hypothetical protein